MVELREIQARPISAAAFACYGDLLAAAPATATPRNGRQGAIPVLEVVEVPGPAQPDCHRVELMERHPCSTQAFFPLDGAAYLIVVAPDRADGGPDLTALSAFLMPGDVAVQYRTAVWHTPLTVLGRRGRFAMLVHKDGTATDCEFLAVPPIGIRLAGPDRPAVGTA